MTLLARWLDPVLRRPLLCLALLWAGGIVLACWAPLSWIGWAAMAGVLVVAWGLLHRAPGVVGRMALALAVVAIAASDAAWHARTLGPDDARYLPEGGVLVLGYPLEPATVDERGWRVTFRAVSRREGARWLPVSSTVILEGADVSAPALGRHSQVLARVLPAPEPRNPFDFDSRQYLAERGLQYRVRAAEVVPTALAAPDSPLYGLRAQLAARLRATMPGAYGAAHTQIINGLVLGIRGEPLAEETVEQYRRAGTIHLMVVSGSQITLLATVLLFPLWLIGQKGRRTSYPTLRTVLLLLSFPLLLLYVCVADSGPSVSRAFIMCLLVTLGVLLGFSKLGRERSFHSDMLTLLAAAALALLAWNPALLASAGAQLSFGAVFGLVVMAPIIVRLLRGWPLLLAWPVAATLSAQAMTYPILAWHFGRLPLLAPLTNLIAVPVVGLLLPLGLLTLVLATVLPAWAVLLNLVNLQLMRPLHWVNEVAARCPWAEAAWYVRSPWPLLGYFVILAVGLRLLSHWADRLERDWGVPAGRKPRMW